MGTLRPPDIIYGVATLSFTVAAVVAVIVLGPSLVEDIRYLGGVISVIQIVGGGVWLVLWNRLSLRRVGYQCYYRFLGPSCTANITGVLQVDVTKSDGAVLNEVHRLTNDVWEDVQVDTRLDNKVVIRLRDSSLTATVVTRSIDDDDDDEPQELIKQVSFKLGGFRGRIASIDDVLRRHAQFLLESFCTELIQQKTLANLVLKVELDDTNPFLTFYLREVASSHPNAFHVKRRHSTGSLDMTATSITVTARTPATLMDMARHYLVSPQLAYGD